MSSWPSFKFQCQHLITGSVVWPFKPQFIVWKAMIMPPWEGFLRHLKWSDVWKVRGIVRSTQWALSSCTSCCLAASAPSPASSALGSSSPGPHHLHSFLGIFRALCPLTPLEVLLSSQMLVWVLTASVIDWHLSCICFSYSSSAGILLLLCYSLQHLANVDHLSFAQHLAMEILT